MKQDKKYCYLYKGDYCLKGGSCQGICSSYGFDSNKYFLEKYERDMKQIKKEYKEGE